MSKILVTGGAGFTQHQPINFQDTLLINNYFIKIV